ncbi:hypothetical protein JCM3770_007392, partial [Rhodotorula araucariae]
TVRAAAAAAAGSPGAGEEGARDEAQFACSYSLPEGRALALPMSTAAAAPPPPPAGRKRPASRIFTDEERDANRRRSEDGWRRIMLGAA